MTTTNTIASLDLFYTVYRNKYLRNLIRDNKYRGLVKEITLDQLENDHQFIASLVDSYNTDNKFNDNNTRNNNIIFKLIIFNYHQFDRFINGPHRHLINSIRINEKLSAFGVDRELSWEEAIEFDLGMIPQGIQRLDITVDESVRGTGQLPDSITELKVNQSITYRQNEVNFFDHLFANLPPNLAKLALPYELKLIQRKVVLPPSLIDLDIKAGSEILNNFVVQGLDRQFKSTIMKIDSAEDLEILENLGWINKIILGSRLGGKKVVVPHHVQHITNPYSSQPFKSITFPPNLKSLHWPKVDMVIEKGLFPDCLKSLNINLYDHPIEPAVLPNGLESLYIQCKSPLEQGSVPCKLKTLFLYNYNHALKSNVLPVGLKSLTCNTFDNVLGSNSLPTTISYLELREFKGSFELVGPLNHLSKLFIDTMDASVSILLANVKRIEIYCKKITPDCSLKHTAIKNLYLFKIGNPHTLSTDFLPSDLVKLVMSNADIKSPNVIPNGCVFLKHDLFLEPSFIPSSVKKIIRSKICRDLKIKVDLKYLDDNHGYLSLLSEKDKIDNNIFIELCILDEDELNGYYDHPHRCLIDTLDIDMLAHNMLLDSGFIHRGVRVLYFPMSEGIRFIGDLPDTITELHLGQWHNANHFLWNLPPHLTLLSIPSVYRVQRRCVMPDTLTRLDYTFPVDKETLDNIVVSPNRNRELGGAKLLVRSRDSFPLIHRYKWVTQIRVSPSLLPLEPNQIPEHIESINVKNSLYGSKQDLECLNLWNPGVLPRGLKSFSDPNFCGDLVKGLLPDSLTSLLISSFRPIQVGVFPNSITEMTLTYTFPLQAGTLPLSLTKLTLNDYNLPLCSHVMPNRLKELHIPQFNKTLEPDSLPASLTSLRLDRFTRSFKSVGPLCNLTQLHVESFNASISILLAHTKQIHLSTEYIDWSTSPSLLNTPIETLRISIKLDRTPIPMSFLPHSLVKLEINNFYINSLDVIPNSCLLLTTINDTDHVNPVFLPKSTKVYHKQIKKTNTRFTP
ncbi:hypothetical protein CYY_000215 [Polysphondylium violaceum]|uniref:FNIP repeat-containing protein n=1 Tax=Polysphondylium violaceum TaxID=133409 RepID=A0A8J4V2L1_9MYCE|nr:hypothetical protein CYY_000215 [Polysphondylium violaceum]